MKPLYLSLTNQGERMDSKGVQIDFSKAEIKMKIITDEQSKEKFFKKREGELIYPEDQFAVLLGNLDFSKEKTYFKCYQFPPCLHNMQYKTYQELSPGLYV